MGLVPVRPCGSGVCGGNGIGYEVSASEMAHSRCSSCHCRQSNSPRVSFSDRRGRRSSSRLCHGSDCSPSLARMALIGWNSRLSNDALLCGDTCARLDDRAIPFGDLGGLLLTLAGLVGHVLWTMGSSWSPDWLSGPLTRCLVGLGLGMTTGSLFVTTAVLLVCTAHWLDCFHGRTEPPDGHVGLWAAMTEGLFVVAMLLVLVASYALKGIVPM